MAAQKDTDEKTEAQMEVPFNKQLRAATMKLNDGHAIPVVAMCTFMMSRVMRSIGKKEEDKSDEEKEQDKVVDKQEEEDIAKAVVVAVQNGYRYIDTAQAYRTEHVIGNALKQLLASATVSRAEMYIKSKVSRSLHRPEDIRQSVEKSLKDLQCDYIDLMLIHSPHSHCEQGKRGQDVIEKYKILHEYKKAGKIKSVGVTDFAVKHLEILEKACPDLPLPAVNQIECTPFVQETDIIDYCNKKGILLEGVCPIEHAKEQMQSNDVLTATAAKYKKTWPQIMLRWLMQRGFILMPISITPKGIIENGDIFDFKLTEEDMAKLNELKKHNIRVFWNPFNEPWDEI